MTKQSSNLLNLSKAADAVGITRKTLYSHINKGLVSITKVGGKRFIDVSELIRHYGFVDIPESKVNIVTPSQSKRSDDVILAEIRRLQDMNQQLLEHHESREAERLEMQQLREASKQKDEQLEVLKAELEKERNRGLLSRLFRK